MIESQLPRNVLWLVMEKKRIHIKYMNIIKDMYEGAVTDVRRQRSSPYHGFAPGLYVKPVPICACYGHINQQDEITMKHALCR